MTDRAGDVCRLPSQALQRAIDRLSNADAMVLLRVKHAGFLVCQLRRGCVYRVVLSSGAQLTLSERVATRIRSEAYRVCCQS